MSAPGLSRLTREVLLFELGSWDILEPPYHWARDTLVIRWGGSIPSCGSLEPFEKTRDADTK